MHHAFCVPLRALVTACLTFLAAGAVAADPAGGPLKAIKERGAVVIGYLRDAYPMSFLGEDGQPAGYSIDICRVIAEDAGKAAGLEPGKVRYVPLTLDGRFDAVAGGAVDI